MGCEAQPEARFLRVACGGLKSSTQALRRDVDVAAADLRCAMGSTACIRQEGEGRVANGERGRCAREGGPARR